MANTFHTEYLLTLSLTELRRWRDRIADHFVAAWPEGADRIESICAQDHRAAQAAQWLRDICVQNGPWDLPTVENLVRICRHLATREQVEAFSLQLAVTQANATL